MKFLPDLSGKWSERLTPFCDQLEILELHLGWCLVLPRPPIRRSPLRRSLQTRHLLHQSLQPSAIRHIITNRQPLQNFIRYPIILSILWDCLPKRALQTAELKQPTKVELLQDPLSLVKTLSSVSQVTITSNLVHGLAFAMIIFLIFWLIGPMTILPLRRLYIERQIQPEMLSFVGTDEVVILFNM